MPDGRAAAIWRPMMVADLPEVGRIAAVVHADFFERPAVFAERLALFADGCLMAPGGYMVAHPTRAGAPPALDTLLGALPAAADTLHLHDVALLPAMQGRGLGAAAVRAARVVAARHGLPRLGLIAVHGTAAYWARFGFVDAPAGATLASYGADARYMLAPV